MDRTGARLLLAALGLAGAVGLALLWSGGDAPDDDGAVDATGGRPVAVPSTPAPPPEPVARTAVAPATPPAPARPERPVNPTAEPAPTPRPSIVEYRGTLATVDPLRGGRQRVDGSFVLVLVRDQHVQQQRVTAEDGAWTATAIDAAWYHVVDVRLDSGAAVEPVGGERWWPVPADHRLAVELEGARERRLRVVDADERTDLRGVRVARSNLWPGSPLRHPGRVAADELLLDAARSPVALPLRASEVPASGALELWVGSAGYAWQRVSYDWSGGELVTVALERGAELEVELAGALPAEPGAMRIGAAGEPHPWLDLELAAGERRLLLDGLRPGSHVVRLEAGVRRKPARVLAETEARLEAGQRTRVRLELGDTPAPPAVRVSGTLAVPRAWEATGPPGLFLYRDARRVQAAWVGEPESGPDAVVHGWRADVLAEGRWTAHVPAHDLRHELEVGPEGLDGVALALPPPVRLAVRTVDRATGEAAPVAALGWRVHRAPGERDAVGFLPPSLRTARRAPGRERFELVVPAGRLELVVQDERYAADPAVVELEPGEREHELAVERLTGFVLVPRTEDGPLRWESGWSLRARELAGPGSTAHQLRTARGLRVATTGAGVYRVELEGLEGFEPVPPLDVDVYDRELTERVVVLRRLD